MSVRQRQSLCEEIEIGEAASRELQVPGIAIAFLLRDEVAHGADLRGNFRNISWLTDKRSDGILHLACERIVSGDHARPRERHMLPKLGLAPLVSDEALE